MKFLRRAALLFALLLSVTSATSCNAFLNTLVYDKSDNTYTDRKTGKVYTDAPACYESTAQGKKYAKWKATPKTNVLFYEIGDYASPLDYITDDSGVILYSSDVSIPAFEDIKFDHIYLCNEYKYSVTVADITNEEHIAELRDIWLNAESVVFPATSTELSMRVKFASDDTPYMFYNLVYAVTNGNTYLYDRTSGRCVPAGDLIASYIDGTAQ